MMEQIGLPSAEVMMRDVIDRIAIEDALADDYSAIEYQGAYTMELIAETDYPSFDVSVTNKKILNGKDTLRKEQWNSKIIAILAQ